MGRWKAWTQIADGPYQGKPELFPFVLAGYDFPRHLFSVEIPDRAGNLIQLTPPETGTTWNRYNLGGGGVLAHLPLGSGHFAVGKDRRLYASSGPGRWSPVEGPGRLLSAAADIKNVIMVGYREILGEGTEHQLAYTFITPDVVGNNTIPQWDNLGQPGEPGGKKGINGRPAFVGDHVLARGQDNHLWHISGTQSRFDQKRAFDRWTNLGGGITQPPVVIRSGAGEGLDCFVIGEQKELHVNTWDGKRWSGFTDLGGQLQGLPAPVYALRSDSTFVFGRGVHNKLWYRRRVGPKWQRWEAVGDDLAGDPAVWDATPEGSDAEWITCVVLRQNGELWQREYHLSGAEGKTGRRK